MVLTHIKTTTGWKQAWKNRSFRNHIFAGLLITVIIFTCLPFFFIYIEQRPGILLNDWVLNAIPAHNVSVFIFICIWSTLLLTLIRAYKSPQFFLLMLYSYAMLCIFRYISMTLVPLETPAGLIPLVDPLSNLFYGKRFVTKDLFFSGHTSTLFLMHLCFYKKNEKYFSLITTILVGCLLLIQHVHYTIDVLTAPIFTYIAFKMSKKWVSSWQID